MSSGEEKEISLFKSFAAGGFGGMCLVVAGHPFDTIKVCLLQGESAVTGRKILPVV